jgi:hypothetical protein
MSKHNQQRRGATLAQNNETTEVVENAIKSGTPVTSVAPVEPKKTASKDILPMPEDVAKLESKSAKIRALAAKGWKTGDIARTMNIRYQHARNVLKQPVKNSSAPAAA